MESMELVFWTVEHTAGSMILPTNVANALTSFQYR